MSMMSDYDQDLDDHPVENKDTPAESLVGSCRAESTDQWTAGSGITTKIPPLAEMHKGLLDREPLIAADGVEYFRDTLRPHFIKEAQSVFLWRF